MAGEEAMVKASLAPESAVMGTDTPMQLSQAEAIFPLRNPAIVSMTAAFLAGVIGSLLTREPRAEALFDDEKLRTYLGVGAE